MPGIYKALLRMFSPETLISRLPRVATFYFSFGKASADEPAGGRARTSLGGLPYSLAPMLAGVVEGFIAVALELSGAKGVNVRTLDVVFDGNVVDGIPTIGQIVEVDQDSSGGHFHISLPSGICRFVKAVVAIRSGAGIVECPCRETGSVLIATGTIRNLFHSGIHADAAKTTDAGAPTAPAPDAAAEAAVSPNPK